MDITEFKQRVSSPRVAPYNTGKLRIGVAYVPRQRWEPSSDAYSIQTALLNANKPRLTLGQRIMEFLS
jgi:hypothetical protein